MVKPLTIPGVQANGQDVLQALRPNFERAVKAAAQRQEKVLCTARTAVRLKEETLLEEVDLLDPDSLSFLWYDPLNRTMTLAAGVTERIAVTGSSRFADLKRWAQDLRRYVLPGDERQISMYGGFSFVAKAHNAPWTNWPDGEFVLPALALSYNASSDSGELAVTLWVDGKDDANGLLLQALEPFFNRADTDGRTSHKTPLASSGSVPPKTGPLNQDPENAGRGQNFSEWGQQVREVAKKIRDGAYQKVVLARESRFLDVKETAIASVLRSLRTSYPENYVFAVWKGTGCFLGASPERLVRVQDNHVMMDCLAGTTARGATPAQDEELGKQLLQSRKDLSEHRVVVHWVEQTVSGLVSSLKIPNQPSLRKLENVQHLHTPVEGTLCAGQSLLDLVERLHPTPAVAGEPREVALVEIATRETTDRGWYAGPIGWFNLAGDGEMAVALRSALVQGNTSYLFAGAGIMGDSNPDSEWLETELKLDAMRTALEQAAKEEAPWQKTRT